MKSQNKKTFVVREGGGKYSLLATACLLALASIANAQEIVSYGQSIDDKQYGIAFDSSVGHSTISGKNDYTSGDTFNVTGDISWDAECYVGIGNYYSEGDDNWSKFADTEINIGNDKADFKIQTNVNSSYAHELYGVWIKGNHYKLSGDILSVYNTTLNVKARDFIIDQQCDN